MHWRKTKREGLTLRGRGMRGRKPGEGGHVAHVSKIYPVSPRPIYSRAHKKITVKNHQWAASNWGLGRTMFDTSVESNFYSWCVTFPSIIKDTSAYAHGRWSCCLICLWNKQMNRQRLMKPIIIEKWDSLWFSYMDQHAFEVQHIDA